MRDIVAAVDPGLSTGIAIWDRNFGFSTQTLPWIAAVSEVKSAEPDIVVVERYTVRPSQPWSRHPEPMWATGALLHWSGDGGPEIAFQNPGFRAPAMDEARKTVAKGATQHEVDAAAHLIMWLRCNQ